MLLHTMGTVAPDVFGNSDALRGIAHRTMRPQTIHKQFLMSGQRFQLNSGRFQGKSVSELLKTLSASVSASSKSTFSTTQKHFFQWNRPEWDWNRCPDTRHHLWIICIRIVLWAIPRSASELPKTSGASVPVVWRSIFGTSFWTSIKHTFFKVEISNFMDTSCIDWSLSAYNLAPVPKKV